MAVIGEATVAVRADTKGFAADTERGVTQGMGGALAKLGGVIAAAGIGRAFATFLGSSVAEAREANKVAAQTAQVIKTTGGVANVTADNVDALADALSRKSGIDDDVIASSEAVLLTFTKVRNEVGEGNAVFDRATQAALDMSVALKTDLQGATLQIGKALNDPIKGITALSRAGVSFTEEQKNLIKSLVETGDVLGAQKIILDELATEFGGQAEAQATAAEKARVGWANYKEEIGKRLVPVIDALFTKFNEALPAIETATLGVIDGIVPAWHRLRDALGPVIELGGAIGSLVAEAFGVLGKTISEVLSPALATLLPQLSTLGSGGSEAAGGMAEFIRSLEGNDTVVASMAAAIGGLGAAFVTVQAIGAVGSAIGGISSLLSGLGGTLGLLTNPIGLVVAGVIALGAAGVVLYKNVKPVHDLFDTIGRFLRDVVWPVIKDVADAIGGPLLVALGASVALLNPWAVAIVGVAAGFKLAYEKIGPFRDVVDTVIGFLRTGLLPILQDVVGWLGDRLGDALGFITGTAFPAMARVAGTVVDALGRVGAFIGDVVATVAEAAGSIGAAIGRWFGPALAKVQQVGEEFLGWLNDHVVPVVVAAGEFFAAVWTRVSEIVSVAFGLIRAVVEPVLSFLVENIGIVVRTFIDVAGPALSAFGASVAFVFGLIKDVIGIALDTILSVVEAVLPTIIDLFSIAFDTIWNVIKVVFDAIKGTIEAALQIVQGIFQVFTGLLTGDWEKLWDGLVNIVTGVFDYFKSFIDGALGVLAAIISGTGEAITSAFLGIWNGVREGVTTLISDVVGFFDGLPGKLLELIGKISEATLKIGKAIIDGIADGISGAVGFVADISQKLLEAVRNLINNFVIDKLNAGIRGVFTLADKVIPDFVSDIGASNAPQIDRLAAGGIVPATPGGRLAVLAEGGKDEAVIPLDRGLLAGLRALAGDGGGQAPIDASVTIMGNVYGVDDLDAYLDARDRRLAELLTARRGR